MHQTRDKSLKFYVVIGLVSIVVAVLIAILANTVRNSSRQLQVKAIEPIKIDSMVVAERLSGAVRIQTISNDGEPAAANTYLNLHAYLSKQYPVLHKTLKREVINNFSLLYTWEGTDPSAAPILLMAHQDVVPIAPGTESQWTHPPFSGDVADGFIWGRGSWDDKGNLLAMMEAVELLIKKGFKPKSTIYLAFGHDEETGSTAGQEGAKKISETLQARGVHLAFVLDEGLLIMHQSIKGIDSPIALIGIAEKGYVTLKISTEATPGHSSMPPQRTAIGSLSLAVSKIERDQFPPVIGEVVDEMFETLAPEFNGINRYALSNLWLFGPYVRRQLQSNPGASAMLQTTTALTTIHAGSKENVLPGLAEATVNFRTLPGVETKDVVSHTQKAVNDPSIKVTPSGSPREASRVSKTSSASYAFLQQTIREVFPEVLIAPGLMTATTDSHHFLAIADNVYRFTPIRAKQDDLARFHGTNERLSVDNYAEMIRFYYRLMSSPARERIRLE